MPADHAPAPAATSNRDPVVPTPGASHATGHGHAAWPAARCSASTHRRCERAVGMSPGGLTALRLAAVVNEVVLIDVTPSAQQRHSQPTKEQPEMTPEMTKERRGMLALMHDERRRPSFRTVLDPTVESAAPATLFHSSRRLDNGNWTVALRRHVPRPRGPVGRRRGTGRARDADSRRSWGFVGGEDAAEPGRRAAFPRRPCRRELRLAIRRAVATPTSPRKLSRRPLPG